MSSVEEGGAWAKLVEKVVEQAQSGMGKQGNLSRQLQRVGVINVETGEPYTPQTIGRWANGRHVPKADVFLAIAKLGGVQLDKLLYPDEEVDRLSRVELELEELRGQMQRLAGAAGSTPAPALQRGGISGQAGLRDSAGG